MFSSCLVSWGDTLNYFYFEEFRYPQLLVLAGGFDMCVYIYTYICFISV